MPGGYKIAPVDIDDPDQFASCIEAIRNPSDRLCTRCVLLWSMRRECFVPRVMIECPETRKEIYTGINLNWETFESYRIGTRNLSCPKCGKDHEWSRSDAIVDEIGGG